MIAQKIFKDILHTDTLKTMKKLQIILNCI